MEYAIMNYGLFVGRFQPFHNGHKHVIDTALKLFDKVIVVVGSHNSPRTPKNPFTVDERIQMIRSVYDTHENNKIICITVEDNLYNDFDWTIDIQRKVSEIVDYEDKITLIGHSKDRSSYYLKLFPEYETYDVPNFNNINASNIRQEWYYFCGLPMIHPKWIEDVPYRVKVLCLEFLKSDEYKKLQDEYNFIEKYKQQWENSPYPPTFVTTDAVVVVAGYVLLIKRGCHPGIGLYALPGGFLGQYERVEDSMIRELREETKIKIPVPVLRGSIVTSKVFDHPDRSSRGRTITHCYLIHLKNETTLPIVKGSDDATHAEWIPISQLNPSVMFEDHYHIVKNMIGKL